LIALLVTGAALPARLVAQDTGFVAWPRELASRAPALSDAIAREFRERPRMIRFGGRDTIHIVFWNPLIWQDDMDSKVLPQKTVPSIREATKNVAQYVWTTFGRDAGIAYIRVSFIRVVHDHKYWNPSHVVEAQEVGGDLTREGLETGQLPMVGIAQREGGAWSPETQKWIDSLRQARSPAIFHAMERDIGQRPTAISLTGRDTIDVSFVNPSFWWKDRFATSLPEKQRSKSPATCGPATLATPGSTSSVSSSLACTARR
jgi:hypothetical protein